MRRFPARLAATICLAVLLATGLAVAQGNVFHGNVKSKIFHRQGCRYFDCAACSAAFPSREAALAAGYRPCKVCNP
jgi:methylphosphotriester-DNA--protein-cysteine methyltransferase